MTAARVVKRIMVGVDGSAASLDALRWAVRLAGTAGGEVTAVNTGPVEPLSDRRLAFRLKLIR
jgi:nucleotide-binding universal stress UspA family protein